MNHTLKTVDVATAYTEVSVGNPFANAEAIAKLANNIIADVIVFPELCITGYTCGDLFHNTKLLEKAFEALQKLTVELKRNRVVIVGLPILHNNAVYNCAAVIQNGDIIGLVPKTYLPNYKEFYEKRWFVSGKNTTGKHKWIPFGTDLLFQPSSARFPELVIGVEICEDLWTPCPPSTYQALGGATLLVNLSASNEIVAKNEYRRDMVKQQSGRCIASYVYTSSGPTESTADVVFGGHCLIADNGNLVIETKRFTNSSFQVATIDIEKLTNERRRNMSFQDQVDGRTWRFINADTNRNGLNIQFKDNELVPRMNRHPFVPSDPETLRERCGEIFSIQIKGLQKRLSMLPLNNPISIGVSGGLDSTLAALVLKMALEDMGWSLSCVKAITMPGFGTSQKTLENSLRLITALGFTASTIDIKEVCYQKFRDMKHKPFGIDLDVFIQQSKEDVLADAPLKNDLVFENVQARTRTEYLMNSGFVIGTGDMSELALGWATYNGDHMSMYNVNCSIPKTLVKFLVKYIAETTHFMAENTALKEILLSIVDTKISPELLPLKNGEMSQLTEDLVGPYELHDFFLYHFVKNNFSPEKIFAYANRAFDNYLTADIEKWQKVFFRRFFANQFKRECVPSGPKVGSVSLSPRGDLRLPPDADGSMFSNFQGL